MAYADTRNTPQRIRAAAAVTLVQVGVGYALVTGLAATFLPRTATKPPIVNNIPLPKPTPRPEKPVIDRKPLANPAHPETHSALPRPQSEFTPVAPAASEGALGGAGSGVEDVRLPLPDPAPTPSLSPIRTKPRGNAGLWVTPNDYPAAELRAEHTGITRFRLTIGPDGRVRDCVVTGTSGWPALDTTACAKLSARARFDPALDSTGARIEGVYTSSVRWQIPE